MSEGGSKKVSYIDAAIAVDAHTACLALQETSLLAKWLSDDNADSTLDEREIAAVWERVEAGIRFAIRNAMVVYETDSRAEAPE